MNHQHFKLRGNHLYNLVFRHQDRYKSHEDNLLKIKSLFRGIRQRLYTDEDASFSQSFYVSISSNPNNTIKVIDGIDDRCEPCSKYDGEKCILFNESDMRSQDERFLMDFFPEIKVGDYVKVSDIIPL